MANISDAGTEYLKSMPGLTMLNLYHTRVTEAGLERLKPPSRARPSCSTATQRCRAVGEGADRDAGMDNPSRLRIPVRRRSRCVD